MNTPISSIIFQRILNNCNILRCERWLELVRAVETAADAGGQAAVQLLYNIRMIDNNHCPAFKMTKNPFILKRSRL